VKPIATYQFKQIFASSKFDLFVDSIRVTGSNAQTDFDVAFSLAELVAQPGRISGYGFMFNVGFIVLLAAVFLLFGIVTFVELQDNRNSLARPFTLVGTLGACGLVIALWNRRKIEQVQFRSDGGVVQFAIPRDRKRAADFDRFVELLIEQIVEARNDVGPQDKID